MIEALLAYFNTFTSLTAEEVAYVKANIPIQHLQKQEVLLETGEVSRAFYFVIEGCIRLYYTVDGEEKTAFFYVKEDFVSSYESFTKQLPAKHDLQAIEPSVVAVISTDVAQDLLMRFPRFEFLARIMMEKELIICQEIIATFITMSPEERYQHLLKQRPDLVQRIPQYYLATYLGVKPESLSRIRKRIIKD